MRSLLLSVLILGLLLGAGLFFLNYAEENFGALDRQIENETAPAIAAGDWGRAAAALSELAEQWQGCKKTCSYFMDSEDLGEIDHSLARVRGFVEGQDAAAALGELFYLQEQLTQLYENELLSLENMA